MLMHRLLALLLILCGSTSITAAEAKNVVLFFVDDQGFQTG